eukprot:TRINITY_DN1916_c0_g1_i2.p1 TRINITY_DN1916_c0_g1~~TRINITY_DN1916_c0_g1_i2.p1  ORF type:complete len:468 (+),score=124.21 TRINITY_DN1916_c0_g1_i2:225-1628(+)
MLGGYARFATQIADARRYNPDRTLVLFAGDLLSPSTLSNSFKGEQMIDLMNLIQVDAASLGNHEFDFGVDVLAQRVEESRFPWINCNLMNSSAPTTRISNTAGSQIYELPLRFESSGLRSTVKLCLLGAAYDVRDSIFHDQDKILYKPIVAAVQGEATRLKFQEGCHLVVALTHQDFDADCELSSATTGLVDLIIGGHDHQTMMQTACGAAPYIKAASDLQTYWTTTLKLNNDSTVRTVESVFRPITMADPSDPAIAQAVAVWEARLGAAMEEVIGCTEVELQATAKFVRQEETNLGDWIADSIRSAYEVDVAIVNSGGIRGNRVYPAGELTKMTVTTIHPFGNKIVVVRTNKTMLQAHLTEALECYDTICGDFLQVSGIKYSFNSDTKQLGYLSFQNDSEIGNASFTMALPDFVLANSAWETEPLVGITSLTDALPMVKTLEEAVQAAQPSCISPIVDRRIEIVRD